MSSPCVIDSAKMEAQLDRFFADQAKEKQTKATKSATKQQNDAVAGMDGDFLTTDALAQMGRPLSRQELVKRLSKMNPSLIFEQSLSFPAIGAVYFMKDGEKKHIVGMEWIGISPEFTTRKIEKDQWGKPQMKGQIRGWRTILMRLIKEKLIGIAEAERVFSIARGRESQRWHETMEGH